MEGLKTSQRRNNRWPISSCELGRFYFLAIRGTVSQFGAAKIGVNGQKHLVQMPCVPGPRPSAPQLIGIVLAELAAPLADGFVGDVNTAFEPHLLHVAIAQGESIGEPEPWLMISPGKR